MKYTKGNLPTWYSDSSSQAIGSCVEPLQRIFLALAQDGWDISAFWGHRGEDDQNDAFTSGRSKACWPKSKHNKVLSEAIDAGPWIPGVGVPGYGDVPNDDAIWIIFAGAVMAKAQELGIKLRWGGLFKNLKDLGHFELID